MVGQTGDSHLEYLKSLRRADAASTHSRCIAACFRRGIVIAALILTGQALAGIEPESIVVADLEGEVSVQDERGLHSASQGTVLEPPFTVRTGVRSSVTLIQGGTRITVKADSELSVPAPAAPGERLDTIRQERGNAHYDVERRLRTKLRIETPFLVSVIKGTEFNVVVDDAQAAVSLFEGRLEIQRGDLSEDLNPGEIAVARAGARDFDILRPEAAFEEALDDLAGAAPSNDLDDDLSDDDLSDDDLSDDEFSDDEFSDDDLDDSLDDDLEDQNDDDDLDDDDDDGKDDDGKGGA